MSTLLLRLAAPMQSWGTDSKFDRRLTGREPTKSGIIGMLACALGIRRDEPINKLKALRFGVRVDQPGEIMVDFHTVHDWKNGKAWVTSRHYLSDAVFLVGIEGSRDLLEEIMRALKNPVFPIYLGRRSCPPAGKLIVNMSDKNLRDALADEKWMASNWYKKKHIKENKKILEVFLDSTGDEDNTFSVRDEPISYKQSFRKFSFRDVERHYVEVHYNAASQGLVDSNSNVFTEHNPMSLLEV